MARRIKDIGSPAELKLQWESGKISQSLETLYKHIHDEAIEVSQWYLDAKRLKSLWARIIRIGAILAVSVSGIIPILAQIYTDGGKPQIAPAWASVALAIAATLALLDRYFGFSSGWMRFVATEQQVSQLTREFMVDWEAMKAEWMINEMPVEPTKEQIKAAITACKIFVSKVHSLVKQETDKWIQEFQSVISQLDDASKAKTSTINHQSDKTGT